MIGAALSAAIFMTLPAAGEAHARQQPPASAPRRALDLPAGRLGDAIVALGRQAGISIGVSDPALANLRVPRVKGRLTPEQALARMLRASPAQGVAVGPSSYRIMRRLPPVPAAPRPRPQPPKVIPAPPPEPITQDEIIVTGPRRPIALSAYSGSIQITDGDDQELIVRGADTDALAAGLPAIGSTHLGPGRNKLFIRGIADSSFNGPTQATTGQYFGETRLNYNAPDPNLRLYDVERVEVLQGPQGTLYGAGSLGGIIRVMPNRPDTNVYEGSLVAGASATWHGDPGADLIGRLNLPLVEDRLGLRLLAYGVTEGGYIDDSERGLDDVNRVRTIGGRAALRLLGPDDWTVDIAATGQRIRGRDAQFVHEDAPPLTRHSAVDQPFSSDYLLADLTLTKAWGDTQFVTSVGLVRQQIEEQYDDTAEGERPSVFVQGNDITLLSAESRLSGGRPDGPGWLVGVSLIKNDSDIRRSSGPADAPVPMTGVSNGIQEAALFGEGSLRLAPRLTATAGARVTHSRLSGTALDIPAFILAPMYGESAKRNQTAVLPSLALGYDAGPNLLLFARYQKSFRPGGLTVSGFAIRQFRNDDVGTVEAGLRYGVPGRSPLSATASLAYTEWRDIQADTISFDGLPATANIGDGRILTLDLSLGWQPLPGLHVDAAAIFNDSRVTSAVYQGSIVATPQRDSDVITRFQLPNVADVTGRIGVDYAQDLSDDLELSWFGAARYTGKSRLGVGPLLGREQGDWLDLTAGARLQTGGHAWSLTVTNLLDARGNRFSLGSPYTLTDALQATPLRPRTVRLGWETRF